MNKIAVDIILVPPDEIIQLAIAINHSLPETVAENHVLDTVTAIPHITVLMGLVSKEQLPIVYKKLESIAKQFSPLLLKITSLETLNDSDGNPFCWLEIEKSSELQALHENVFRELRPIFSYDAQKEMFYMPPDIDEVPKFWQEGVAENNVIEKYTPHITLGRGASTSKISPKNFIATEFALGHIGNHGTCRDILWSTHLKKFSE